MRDLESRRVDSPGYGHKVKGTLRARSRSRAPPRRGTINREEATEQILEAKKEKGLTFQAIAEKVGRDKVWTTAALLSQHPMSAEEADAAVDLLGLGSEVAQALQEIPMRGSLDQDVPVDPTIYRIHEVTQVYGTTIKALINEEFGDGIMSAVTFMDIQREDTDQGPGARSSPTRGVEPERNARRLKSEDSASRAYAYRHGRCGSFTRKGGALYRCNFSRS